MNADSGCSTIPAKPVQLSLFSLNIAFAIVYALFAYDGSSYLAVHGPDSVQDSLQAFRTVLSTIAPLAVEMRTKSQHLRSVLTREGLFLVLVIAIALPLYFLVRSLERTAVSRVLLVPISAIMTVIFLPACWLYIVYATWRTVEGPSFWAAFGTIFVLETAVAGALVYFFRNQAIWLGTLVFAFHYVFWAALILRQGHLLAPLAISLPLSLVFPWSGYAWLRHVQESRQHQTS